MGNAYAQIIRDSSGDLVSLWPLSPDQTEVFVDSKGQVAYKYQKDGKTYILGVNDVLHIKDIGNGLIGLSKLSFMSSSVKEATDTQKFATANAENYGNDYTISMTLPILSPSFSLLQPSIHISTAV